MAKVKDEDILREALEFGDVPSFPEYERSISRLVKKGYLRPSSVEPGSYELTKVGFESLPKSNSKSTYRVIAIGRLYSPETGDEPYQKELIIEASSHDEARKKAQMRMSERAEKMGGYEFYGRHKQFKSEKINPGSNTAKDEIALKWKKIVTKEYHSKEYVPGYRIDLLYHNGPGRGRAGRAIKRKGWDIISVATKNNIELIVDRADTLKEAKEKAEVEAKRIVEALKKIPQEDQGKIKKIITKLRDAGNSLPPHVQIGAGAVIAIVPIPEPILETSTDVAGVIMVKDGIDRIKNKRRKNPRSNKTDSSKLLISKCHKLWENYCSKPNRKHLSSVLSHLKKMEKSKDKSVKHEMKRCRKAARAEAKLLGMSA